MKIQILGTGCSKCKNLEKVIAAAAQELQLDCQIEKVTDLNQIMAAGVMLTPALVVDGVVKTSGKVPSIDEAKALLN